MTVIQSEVRITGQDAGASAMIDRIGKKLDAMGKAARISPEVDKLASSLGRAEAQLRAIDKLNSAKTLSDLSKKKADEARRKVADIKTAMEGVEAPTKRMVATLEKAEAAEARYIAQARRRATAVLEAGSALNKLGVSARQAGTAEAALKTEIDATTSALEKQMLVERQQAAASAARVKQATAAQRGKRGGHGDNTFTGLAGMYIGHEVGHFAHNVVERYGEFDRERRYAKVVMGLTDDEQEPLIRQAIHGGSTTRFNDVQWLDSQRELAARGYNRDQVMAFAPIAAQIGQAFDKTMPEGVKALEGALLGFKKDTSTYEAAMASAQRTADLQVKASKISGMGYDDVVATYKYAAAPAQMAHLSEEQMLAFAAISKKANMGGDESGVAFRALAKNLLTPTAGAQIAMRAAGINYNAFQHMPDRLDTGGFVDMVAKNFGVKLDDKARGTLDGIFSNKALVNDATAFMPAVREALSQVLGGDDAKSKGKIAGLARSYRDASVQGIDTDGLMSAMMSAMSKNPALANAIFGSKQGGRIFAALGDPGFYAKILGELQHESQGFAGKVSDARMEGFSAAVQKLQGSLANVETAIGRSLDNGGKGGLLTDGTNAISGLLNAFTDATPQVHQLAAAAGAAVAAWGAIKGFNLLSGGFGLNASATHLDEAAVQHVAAAADLKAAAASLGGKGAAPGGGSGAVPGGSGGPGGPGGISEPSVDKTGKATPFRNIPSRIVGNVLANAPVLMSAYDDLAHPAGRQERYEKQAEGAAEGRAAVGDIVRAARDRLGLGRILRFSDDAKVMAGDEQGPRMPPALVEEDALRRALRRIRITSDTPSDPWLGGERQAIEYRAIRSADAFRRDPEGARGRAMMSMEPAAPAAQQGPIDVTGKVQAEVTSKVETQSVVKVEVTAAPGIEARQTFQSTTTRVSNGKSMPNAGLPPHIARRDE